MHCEEREDEQEDVGHFGAGCKTRTGVLEDWSYS
jgi:hypothetical protein